MKTPRTMRSAIVCGTREPDEPVVASMTVRHVVAALRRLGIERVITGGANGIDQMAAEAACDAGLNLLTLRAQWDLYGRRAGPIRNGVMLAQRPEVVVAINAKGPGTKDCLRQAQKAGIRTVELAETVCYDDVARAIAA